MLQPATRLRWSDRAQRPGPFELLTPEVREAVAARRRPPAPDEFDLFDADLPAFTPDDPAEALTAARMEGLVCVVSVTCPSLRERQAVRVFSELRDLAAQHPAQTRYALSLAAVTHVGIATVPVLIEMDAWFRRGGRRFVLTDCPRAWRRVLRSARLDRALPIERDLAAARRALR